MAYLIDTSILARLANGADPSHDVALMAVVQLHRRGEDLHVTSQNLVEFRSLATRPIQVNGLGLSAKDAESKSAVFEAAFPLLVETPEVYPAWKALVAALGVLGKQVHDARLVAVCHAHRIDHLLTFNIAHFARMASFGPGLEVVDPPKLM